MKTMTATLDSSTQVYDDIWKVFDVADYTDVIIRLRGIWDGPITFWGDNTYDYSVPLAVQEIGGTDWTAAAVSETGSSPSDEVRIFRVPVAGLVRVGIYGDIFAEAPNQFSGLVDLTVTAVSNTNAR